jgi:predicted PurR-regulated permease PerM
VTLDNFLRPVLIRKGADLPLLLIFAGVLGGMLSFGLIGIFVGPVVLAVTYTLMLAWIEDALGKDDSEAAELAGQGTDLAAHEIVGQEAPEAEAEPGRNQ